MLPIHLIALNMEHVYVKFAIDAARSRGYGIKGIRVDCVYWDDRRSSNGSAKDKHHDMHCHMQDVCKESRDSPIESGVRKHFFVCKMAGSRTCC